MLLKNHLIEVFKKASLENNFLLKENIVLKWVHRFGIDSLNDLLIHSSKLSEKDQEEENQEQISSIGELNEEENQKQISLIGELNEEENQEQISSNGELSEEENQDKWELTDFQTAKSNEIISKNQDSSSIKQNTKKQKLPLPNIKNLRKWINKDKKAS